MVTCKWYVSVERTECGDLAVGEVTHIPLRSGKVKKLEKPLPVCAAHQSRIDRMFATLRTSSHKAI